MDEELKILQNLILKAKSAKENYWRIDELIKQETIKHNLRIIEMEKEKEVCHKISFENNLRINELIQNLQQEGSNGP